MFEFALIIILAGFMILVGIAFWTHMRQELGDAPEVEQSLSHVSLAKTDNAVIVAREYGQIIYINELARDWLEIRSGTPDLEFIARNSSPSDSFRALFAGQGQATFQLGNRWVEAMSHTIPVDNELQVVVTLHEVKTTPSLNDAFDVSASMRIIDEIGETINASLRVEQVLQAILAIISKNIDISAGEICLWDAKDKALYQRGWIGDSMYVVALANKGGLYYPGEGITGWIAKHQEPLLVSDRNAVDVVKPKLKDNPYYSFVAIPLILGEQFLGTLELTHTDPGHFQQAHLALLKTVSKPVSTAIYNAELYSNQRQRVDDLANLQQIADGQDIENNVSAVYEVMNERIANLIDAKIVGVTLYDERRQLVVGQPPFYGLPDALSSLISIPVDKKAFAHDIWMEKDYWIANDLTDEPMLDGMGLTPVVAAAGIHNLILMTMRIGRQRIGMMFVGNKNALAGFNTQDIQNLRILVTQAGIVVENVRLHQREQRQDTELVGLQEITHAIGALSNEDEVYVFSDINTRIAGLMDISMCGVLLYDEERNVLVAQPPFFGVEDDQIHDYVIDLNANDVISELWMDEDFWFTNRVQTDSLVFSVGLGELAERIGVHKTMFASLTAGGKKIGLIQVSNKLNGDDFNTNDARLLMIFATQAAAIIENARLVREVQQRAEEAYRLRSIAERAGNVVTMDETLAPVLSEVAQLMTSQLVFLSVIDDEMGGLITHPRAVFGAEIHQPLSYHQENDRDDMLVALTGQSLLSNDPLIDADKLDAYDEIIERLGIYKLLVVPMLIGERSLGELGIANRSHAPYDEDDIRLLGTVATQLASTIDRVRLFEAAGENLNRRVLELDAISTVSNTLNVTIEFNAIIEVIRQQIMDATAADGSTIAMIYAVEHWDENATPSTQLAYRIGLDEFVTQLTDIELAAIDLVGEAVIISNYHASPMNSQPITAASAVAISIMFSNIPVGVIHLYSERLDYFDEGVESFLRTMASKASLGYGNAVRQNEMLNRSRTLSQRVEQLNQIFELGQMLQTNIDQDSMLEAIAYSIVQSVGFDVVVITMVDQQSGLLRRQTQVGLPVDVFERSKADVLPLELLSGLLREELRISESYFYTIDSIIEWEIAGLDALSTAYVGNRTIHTQSSDSWQDGDMLLVPISGSGGEILGVITLDRPQDNIRPDRSKVEILEIFAHQAASTIENNRLYLNSVRSAKLESHLNAILEDIASTLDINEIIESVAHNALRLAPFQHMTVALQDDQDNGYEMVRISVGNDDLLVTTTGRNTSLKYTALGRSIETGVDYVYTPNNDIGAYKDLTQWHEEGERISLVMPLTAGGETLGAMHFGSSSQHNFDLSEFIDLFGRVAKLMAVAIQNARLFSQAINLKIYNESVVESIQQGIVVLDQSGRVISANRFTQEAYGWTIQRERQDIFKYSPELAEILADDLRKVLETGEPYQILNQITVIDDIDIVRNFYLYPLISKAVVSGAVLLIEDVTERARLEENLSSRAQQLAALTRASSRITSSLERNEVVDLALDAMKDVIDYTTMSIWRYEEPAMMRLVGVRGLSMSLSPPLRANIADVYRINHIVDAANVLTIDDLPSFLATYNYILPGDSDANSWLGVPLVYQDSVIGMIAMTHHAPGYFTQQSEQAARAFANQVAVALTNADLFTETATRTERLSILNRVSLSLVQSMDTETIFEIALSEIAHALNAEKSRALLFDVNGEMGRVIVDAPRGDMTPTQQLNLRESATFRYILDRFQPMVYSHDRTNMPEVLPEEIRVEIEQRGLKDYLLVPMVAPGYIIGAFEFETRTEELILGADTIEIALIIANQTAIAIQNATQLEETTSRTRELETLLEAAQSTSLTMDLQQVFKTVADLFISALDIDDCAIMIWDDVENSLEVQIDVNRSGNPDRISPRGTKFDLQEYPSRLKALRSREVVVVRATDLQADGRELAELNSQGDHVRMFVPLVVREQSTGLIQVEVQALHRVITEQEQRLARALGAQVAVAIENARLSTETAAQMDELFFINDLSQSIAATIDSESMLRIVEEHIPSVTNANQLYLALYDSKTEMITFPLAVKDGEKYEIPPRELNDDEVSFIIRKKRPLNLGGDYFSADDVRKSMGLSNGEGDLESYLGVPLMSGDEVFGVLAVRDDVRTRVFGLNDQRILTTVGSQLGAALQNARLFQQIQSFADELNNLVDDRTEELQEERDRLDMLYQITAELALTLDMDRVLSRALQMIASAVKAHDGVIMLIDPMTDRLYNRASLSKPVLEGERQSHPAESIATWLIHNDHELLVTDLTKEPFWDTLAPDAGDWRSAMAVLLETNEDVQGVLVLLSRDIAAFSDPLLNLVIAAANQVASAINNADLYQLIRDQAERLGTLLRTEQEEAEKNSAILEGIADGVMLTNTNGKISLFNSAAEEMLGLPQDQAMGRNLTELIEYYNEPVITWAKSVLEWTQSANMKESGLFPADRLEVGERVVSVNISPVYASGQYIGAVSVFRDVTRDVEVDNLKNEFILNVTHELRTPMTSIKGFAEMMLLKGMMNGMSDDLSNDITVIKNNADRLAALIEDLITISQLDAGKSPLNVEPVDLGEIINIQITNANNRHYDKHLEVILDIDENLPRAALDRGKTHQIISNIVDNAFNYTPSDGTITIGLNADSERDRHILFTVQDTGLGIPKEFQERIWDRFARYDEHALKMEISGTGLGLSIVRDLVNMHDSKVWFESEEGVGTTFYVSFPIEHKRTAATSTSTALKPMSGD